MQLGHGLGLITSNPFFKSSKALINLGIVQGFVVDRRQAIIPSRLCEFISNFSNFTNLKPGYSLQRQARSQVDFFRFESNISTIKFDPAHLQSQINICLRFIKIYCLFSNRYS